MDRLRRLGPWLGFWRRSARAAYRLWGSGLRILFWIATAVTIFGLAIVFWRPLEPDRPLAVPLLIIGVLVLVSLCHGAYLTWRREVNDPRAERDEARSQLAEAEQDLDEVDAIARNWRLLLDLIRLKDHPGIPSTLSAPQREPLDDPQLEAIAEGKARISLQSALDLWSQQVHMALGRANRVEASRQFKEAGDIDPPVTMEKLRAACVARKTLVANWATVGSELFPDLGRGERTEVRRGRIRQRL